MEYTTMEVAWLCHLLRLVLILVVVLGIEEGVVVVVGIDRSFRSHPSLLKRARLRNHYVPETHLRKSYNGPLARSIALT